MVKLKCASKIKGQNSFNKRPEKHNTPIWVTNEVWLVLALLQILSNLRMKTYSLLLSLVYILI